MKIDLLVRCKSRRVGGTDRNPWALAAGTAATTTVLISALLVLILIGCGKGDTSGTLYHCPMHPSVVSNTKGTCPICNMDLVPVKKSETKPAAGKAMKYYCPMHPEVVSDKPGSTCSLCDGMELVPMEGAGDNATGHVPGRTTIAIMPAARERMGLRLGAVEKRQLNREIRTSARVVVDETRLHHVTVKVEGWIGKLFVGVTGQEVKKGDPLLTIYSPELVSGQEEYLVALRTSQASGDGTLLASARRRLELWDIAPEQIKELETTGEVQKQLLFRSHVSGVLLEREVLAGHKVMPNEPLMTIADLSTVWVDAAIYQADLPYVKIGMEVEISLPEMAGKVYHGKVSFITPTADPATRTLRARVEVPNPDGLLKPDMLATAHLKSDLGEQIAVPRSAVIFTGTRAIVFREAADHHLEPVEVKLGARSDEFYEVSAGVAAGDQVVIAANFLVDSESSIKAALEALSGGAAQPAAHPEH